MEPQIEQIIVVLKDAANEQLDEFKALDRKAQINIGIGSAVFAFIGALGLSGSTVFRVTPTVQSVALGLAFAAYASSFLTAYLSIVPRTWKKVGVVSPARAAELGQMSAGEFTAWTVLAYASCYEDNARTLQRKAQLVKYSTLLIGLVIALVVLAAAGPVVQINLGA